MRFAVAIGLALAVALPWARAARANDYLAVLQACAGLAKGRVDTVLAVIGPVAEAGARARAVQEAALERGGAVPFDARDAIAWCEAAADPGHPGGRLGPGQGRRSGEGSDLRLTLARKQALGP